MVQVRATAIKALATHEHTASQRSLEESDEEEEKHT
jgi:hypothetical protein